MNDLFLPTSGNLAIQLFEVKKTKIKLGEIAAVVATFFKYPIFNISFGWTDSNCKVKKRQKEIGT